MVHPVINNTLALIVESHTFMRISTNHKSILRNHIEFSCIIAKPIVRSPIN